VAVVLQKLRVRDAVLVGHSAGGWVAASVAAAEAEAQAHRSDDAAPRAVGGMVLLDPVIQEATAYEQHAALSADAERAHNAQRYGGIEKRFNGFVSAEAMQARKRTHLFAPFYAKNDHFTKTGSGHTQKNSPKKTR
jgi:pimeloyl-ACP methyl ester carboxylesterase